MIPGPYPAQPAGTGPARTPMPGFAIAENQEKERPMSLAIQHPAPPVVLTLVLHPGRPARLVDDVLVQAETIPDRALAAARPAEPEEEPTWEDAAWY